MKKKALVIGSSGQDGSYMSDLLLSKGYDVIPCTREDNVFHLIEFMKPDEVYNFASSSNVFNPWENIDYVFETDGRLPQRLLECILKHSPTTKYFQASSCLVFGRNTDGIQNEITPANPIHPYGTAKLYADNMVNEFRRVHGLFACSGIFFNHESPRRGDKFFSKKVTTAAAKGEKIKLGRLDALRDMGYAPDFVEAAYLMLQNEKPTDYIIGTGNLNELTNICRLAYSYAGLDWEDFVEYDKALDRTHDTSILKADITKIRTELGWEPKHSAYDVIKIMIDHARTV